MNGCYTNSLIFLAAATGIDAIDNGMEYKIMQLANDTCLNNYQCRENVTHDIVFYVWYVVRYLHCIKIFAVLPTVRFILKKVIINF